MTVYRYDSMSTEICRSTSIKFRSKPIMVCVIIVTVIILAFLFIPNTGINTGIHHVNMVKAAQNNKKEADLSRYNIRPKGEILEIVPNKAEIRPKDKNVKETEVISQQSHQADQQKPDFVGNPTTIDTPATSQVNTIMDNSKTKLLDVSISIMTDEALHVTDSRYLSLGLDVNLIRKRWVTLNFTCQRLITMAKSLSPAYLRVSGTDADRMIFDEDAVSQETDSQDELDKAIEYMNEAMSKQPIRDLFPATNFTMNGKDWDNINIFAKQVGWRIIFGLNAQFRNGTKWDPTNAKQILQYSIKHGYYNNLDFELGNEPDNYKFQTGMVVLNGTEYGKDVLSLYELLKSPEYALYYNRSKILGPGVAFSKPEYVTDFLNVSGHVIQAVTWHHYYGGPKLKYVENYTNPIILDKYSRKLESVALGIKRSSFPNLPSWQGETSSIWGPPGTDIDMSYVAGFMLLDKMGLNAKLGDELFVRQTFYGFWFALVDQALQPTPGFWIGLLYKKLVGREVLDINIVTSDTPKNNTYARFYAHCTPAIANYPKGAVTLYGMNLYDVDINVTLSEGIEVDQYVLTPGGYGGITSRLIALNNRILVMPDEQNLPDLKPKSLPPGKHLKLRPKTMGYFVLKNAKAKACTKNDRLYM